MLVSYHYRKQRGRSGNGNRDCTDTTRAKRSRRVLTDKESSIALIDSILKRAEARHRVKDDKVRDLMVEVITDEEMQHVDGFVLDVLSLSYRKRRA